MKNANLLTRAELKKVSGGLFRDVCENQSGADLEVCRFNVCMSGWDTSTHTQTENNNKIDSCDSASQSVS